RNVFFVFPVLPRQRAVVDRRVPEAPACIREARGSDALLGGACWWPSTGGADQRRQRHGVRGEPVEALRAVQREAVLAKLAIGDDVNAGLHLLVNSIGHGAADALVPERSIVRLAGLLLAENLEHLRGTGETAHKRCENVIGAVFHVITFKTPRRDKRRR